MLPVSACTPALQQMQYALTSLIVAHEVAMAQPVPQYGSSPVQPADAVLPQCTRKPFPRQPISFLHSFSPTPPGPPSREVGVASDLQRPYLFISPVISCSLADQDKLFLLTVICLWKSTDFCCFIIFYFYQPNVTCKEFPNMHDHIQNLLQGLFSRYISQFNKATLFFFLFFFLCWTLHSW